MFSPASAMTGMQVVGRAVLALALLLPDITGAAESGDRPPRFVHPTASFEVLENVSGTRTAAKHRIGAVEASDPDIGDRISYMLTGQDADIFSIDDDGVIVLNSSTEFDRLLRESYHFEVVATSNGKSASLSAKVVVVEPAQQKKRRLMERMLDQTFGVSLSDALEVSSLNLNSGAPDERKWELEYNLWHKTHNNIWTPWEYEESWASEELTDTIKRKNLDGFVRTHGLGVDLAPERKLRGRRMPLWSSARRIGMKSAPIVLQRRISYDGDLDTLLLSIYRNFRRNDYAGLALVNSFMDFYINDESFPQQDKKPRLEFRKDLTTRHAFLSMDMGYGLNLWLSAGSGKGETYSEIRFADNSFGNYQDGTIKHDSNTAAISHRADLGSLELSTEIRRVARTNEIKQRHFDRDALRFTTESNRLEVADIWVDLEAARSFFHAPGLLLQPFVSVLERRRDYESSEHKLLQRGTFAGGGIRVHWRWGVQVELSGHGQVSGKEDIKEEMIKRRVHFDPNNDERGMMFSMESGLESVELANGIIATSNFVNYDLGYAFPTWFAGGGVSRFSVNAVSGDLTQATTYSWRFTGRKKVILLSLAKDDYVLEFSVND